MYIAQATNGTFKILKNLGVIDPQEDPTRTHTSCEDRRLVP
jgi:hypothetical protein